MRCSTPQREATDASCCCSCSDPRADARLAQTEPPRGKADLAVRGKTIDQRIAEFMAANDVPGLAMAIVQAPYIPRSAGYGRASLAHDELASTRTMWAIGPMTQGFTAVAVLPALRRRASSTSTIRSTSTCPALPPAWAKITILDLLQHASGIPDYRSAGAFKEGHPYLPARTARAGRIAAGAVPARRGGPPERHEFRAARHDRRAREPACPITTSSGASRSSRSGSAPRNSSRTFARKAFRDRSGAAGGKQHSALHVGSAVHQSDRARDRLSHQRLGPRRGRCRRLGKSVRLREPVVVGRGHQRLGRGAGRRHPGQAAGQSRADLQADDARQRHGRAGDGRLGVHEASRLHGDQGLGAGLQRLSQPLHRSGRSRLRHPAGQQAGARPHHPRARHRRRLQARPRRRARPTTSSWRRRASGASTRRWRGSSWR